jgi:hypothetical protein
MRYTGLERWGVITTATKQLVTSEYFKKKATKNKHPTLAADGIIYYMPYTDIVSIFIPETHPLFNYPMLVYSEDGYAKIHRDRVRRGNTTLSDNMLVMINKFSDSVMV